MKRKLVILLFIAALLATAWLIYSRPMPLARMYPMLSEGNCVSVRGYYEIDQPEEPSEFSFAKGSEAYQELWELFSGRKYRRMLKNLLPEAGKSHRMEPGDFRWDVSFMFEDIEVEDGSLAYSGLRFENFYGDLGIYFNGEKLCCKTAEQDRWTEQVLNVIAAEAGEEEMKDYYEEAARLRTAIDSAPQGEGLSAFGGWTPGDDAVKAIEDETEKLTGAGYDLGYLMIDVNSGKGIAFNADRIFCSQSTIKGPYIASMYEEHPESFAEKKDKIRDVLKLSDNDAYSSLRQTYLSVNFKNWIGTCGLRGELSSSLYVNYSAREFAKLWTEMYRFFHTTDNRELCDFYIGSKFSAVYNELGSEYTVRSKAGWEDGIYGGSSPLPEYVDKDPYNDEVATNDGALVYADNGEYIFVILTDVPADYDVLRPLVRAVDGLHKSM